MSWNENHTDLTYNNYKYHYDMIKWRMAETLIQELFLACHFDVFHYGMENTIPGIMDLLKWIRSDVAQDIKKAPDFVIHNRATRAVYFAEIKFRASRYFSIQDVNKGYPPHQEYPYHNAYFIVVSKKDIKCLSYEELKSGEKISPESDNHIEDRKEFNLNKEVVAHFCKFAGQFFEWVNWEI